MTRRSRWREREKARANHGRCHRAANDGLRPSRALWWGTWGFAVVESMTMLLSVASAISICGGISSRSPRRDIRSRTGCGRRIGVVILSARRSCLRIPAAAAKKLDERRTRLAHRARDMRGDPVRGALVGFSLAARAVDVERVRSVTWVLLGFHASLIVIEAIEVIGAAVLFVTGPDTTAPLSGRVRRDELLVFSRRIMAADLVHRVHRAPYLRTGARARQIVAAWTRASPRRGRRDSCCALPSNAESLEGLRSPVRAIAESSHTFLTVVLFEYCRANLRDVDEIPDTANRGDAHLICEMARFRAAGLRAVQFQG